MGGGRWDVDTYKSSVLISRNLADTTGKSYKDVVFAYNNTREARVEGKVHPDLDPKRINKKALKKLESRDSVDHPESNAVLVCFDVTGSNYNRAVEAQQQLSKLMELLGKYLTDPQVSFASNDDFTVSPTQALQISEFESDNRINEHLGKVVLVGKGGGNQGESYDLVLYAAARKTVLDCYEVRKKKGYLFLYADEPFFNEVSADVVKDVFGDRLEADIPIKKMIKEVEEMYNVYIIWPDGGFLDAREQYVKLFGKERVLILQDPNLICELIGSVIGLNEEKIADADTLTKDLLELGNTKEEVAKIIKTASQIKRKFRLDDVAAGD